MSANRRDENRVPNIAGVSSLTFLGNVEPAVDPTTHELLVKASITPSGTQDTNIVSIGGVAITLGQKAMAASFPVTISSDQASFPVTIAAGSAVIGHVITDSGSVTSATLTAETTKVIGVVRNADGSGNLLTSTGNALDVNLKTSSITLTVSGTVTANQGTSPWIVAGGGTAGTAASGVLTIQGIAAMTPVQVSQATASNLNATVVGTGTFAVQATLQTQTDTVMVGGVNIKEINAVTPLMGNGTTGTGSLRVTIASDNTAFAVNATLSAETTKVIGTVNQGTSPWTVSTKSALTASSPTAATVGTSTAQAVASNANRKGLVLTNTSVNRISFGIGVSAVLNSGITLFPGGTWYMDENSLVTGAINAIAGAASSNLAIQEFG